MKITINFLKIAVLAALFSLPLATAQASDEPPLKQYLECLNQQTRGNNNKNSDRIANADKVIEACASERQAVLDSLPREDALAQLGRIERHLKGRESEGEETEEGDQ